jgi:hypothetical protein
MVMSKGNNYTGGSSYTRVVRIGSDSPCDVATNSPYIGRARPKTTTCRSRYLLTHSQGSVG